MPPKPEHPLGFGGRPGLSHAKDECCPTLHSCRRCTERELNSSDLRVDLSWHRHLLLPLNWPLSLEKSDTSNATALPVSGSYDPRRQPLTTATVQWLKGKWLVAPTHRLMACAIEKNGATEWLRLFGTLNGKRSARHEDAAW